MAGWLNSVALGRLRVIAAASRQACLPHQVAAEPTPADGRPRWRLDLLNGRMPGHHAGGEGAAQRPAQLTECASSWFELAAQPAAENLQGC
jgi:hypothetical protein